MITRHWRGWTAVTDAEDYEHFLLSELFPSMRTISGFLGADPTLIKLVRRGSCPDVGDDVENVAG